uniref:Sulfatase-modifying factor enzyme-like domain-containing protein n=1 Tax=Magnetococcus massalia (strain MO-1) TaxID=451514 RepID=A0A1S7LDW9_MAGMO|nr:Conserved protein of unknown function [Candidatus Magnetococcus massalia]
MKPTSSTHPLLKKRLGTRGGAKVMARRKQAEAEPEGRWGGVRLLMGSILFIVLVAAALTVWRAGPSAVREQMEPLLGQPLLNRSEPSEQPLQEPASQPQDLDSIIKDEELLVPQPMARLEPKGAALQPVASKGTTQPRASTGTPSCLAKLSQQDKRGVLYLAKGHHTLLDKDAGHEASRVLNALKLNRTKLESGVWMAAGEVTIDQFRNYVDAVRAQPEGPAKDAELAQIGVLWDRTDPKAKSGGLYARAAIQPVRGVSHEAAMAFAAWYGEKNGCALRLPTREEWAAAVINRFNGWNSNDKDKTIKYQMDSLMRGVREWSLSSCSLGYYLLGQDDWTGVQHVAAPVCMPASLSVAGFRLVMDE